MNALAKRVANSLARRVNLIVGTSRHQRTPSLTTDADRVAKAPMLIGLQRLHFFWTSDGPSPPLVGPPCRETFCFCDGAAPPPPSGALRACVARGPSAG